MFLGPLLSLVVITSATFAAYSDLRPIAAVAAAIAAGALALAARRPARTVCAIAALGALSAAHAAAARDRVLSPRTAGLVEDTLVVATGVLMEDAQPAPGGGVRLLLDIGHMAINPGAEPDENGPVGNGGNVRVRAQVFVGGKRPEPPRSGREAGCCERPCGFPRRPFSAIPEDGPSDGSTCSGRTI
jgi:hypothetical protein